MTRRLIEDADLAVVDRRMDGKQPPERGNELDGTTGELVESMLA